jgi:hypothetical protein
VSPILHICQYIDATQSSTAFRESFYVFPIVEGIHVISLAFSVGLIIWFDLRLAGLILTDQPVSAVRCYGSPFFWIKMGLLLLAGVNIAIYHFTIDRRQTQWDKMLPPPLQARIAGFASLALWIGIIAAGRLMAYFL